MLYIDPLTPACIDLIIVFRDGQVVEQGTHDELLAKRGLYYSMWIQQSSLAGEGADAISA
jgi:ABC-type multidrug transport system fused ATPase/permease subunit